MNAEMLDRLERTFREEEMQEGTYGPQLAGLLDVIGRVMRDAGSSCGFTATATVEGSLNWMDNAYAYDQAVQAATEVFKRLRPPGDRSGAENAFKLAGLTIGPGVSGESIDRNKGRLFANTALAAIAGEEISSALSQWSARPRRLLGSLVERLSTQRRQK
jgi:hypothetical protein